MIFFFLVKGGAPCNSWLDSKLFGDKLTTLVFVLDPPPPGFHIQAEDEEREKEPKEKKIEEASGVGVIVLSGIFENVECQPSLK